MENLREKHQILLGVAPALRTPPTGRTPPEVVLWESLWTTWWTCVRLELPHKGPEM